MEERFPLMKGFPNEFVLLVIQFKNCLLQIPDSSVHEFC
jgi:hypothetical protein